MKYASRRPLAIGLGAICALAISVSAEVTHHVAWSTIEVGAWSFKPIYTEENNSASTIAGFLALADPASLVGSNLVAVWFQRETSGWSAKSWPTTDRREAIKSVKLTFGIQAGEDERWDLGDLGDPTVVLAQPMPYTQGVLASDPLAEAISSSPVRDEFVDVLTAIGYQAANLLVEQDDGCTTNEKLEGMAAAITETLHGEELTSVDRSMNAWIAAGVADCGLGSVAVEIITYPPGPPTPWATPTYFCSNDQGDFLWSQCLIWTETRTLTQRRTRSRFNPGTPPPVYQYCDETRTGTQRQTTSCCITGVMPITFPPPCPTVPPGTTPAIGVGCTSTLKPPNLDPFIIWGPWSGPPCPF